MKSHKQRQSGWTILHDMTRNGLSQIIQLIGDKCDWTVVDLNGNTPISFACQYCNIEDVQFGIEKCGADPFDVNEQVRS